MLPPMLTVTLIERVPTSKISLLMLCWSLAIHSLIA